MAAFGCSLTRPKPLSAASTTAPVATAARNTLSMMKLRSCIWPTITPGSNTRDFSSAKPNTTPMSRPTKMASETDMRTSLRSEGSGAAEHEHRGGDAAGEHGSHRHGRADRELRHARQPVPAGAAVRQAGAEQQQESAGEGDGVAPPGRGRAERARPDRRDRPALGARELHRDKRAERDARDEGDLPPVLAGRGDVAGDIVDLQ